MIYKITKRTLKSLILGECGVGAPHYLFCFISYYDCLLYRL